MSPSLVSISVLFVIFLSLCLVKGGEIRLPSEKMSNKSEFCQGIAKPGFCPVKCFRADPVCGEDSVTYWCGCADALCNGVSVVKQGACDVGNGVGLSVPGQALLLIHIVWLMLLGFSILLGLF
ncbi:hypothetical protein AALP_AA6G015200 [Arabis alpina]|uniref:Kazal-like domain-containing protein n=1 Tax=Arabis alpina TaxID=50452 RepID=A0A087GLD9_ARAAL|nr:hypothetical protein AALP_AA6G015200 [Arabis alpina]